MRNGNQITLHSTTTTTTNYYFIFYYGTAYFLTHNSLKEDIADSSEELIFFLELYLRP